MWAEEIGGISFIGSHPALSPFYTQSEHPAIYADPLMVSPIIPLLANSLDDLEDGDDQVLLSFTDEYKAEIAQDYEADHEYAIRYQAAVV